MSTYWIKKGKKIWNHGRSRGLEGVKERVGDILPEIKDLIRRKDKIKILEVGCGYGRAILELKKIFEKNIETYAINKEPRWNLGLIKRYATAEGIFTKNNLKSNLPKLYILDAGKRLPFKSKSFDYVYSIASVQYISDKALFLEEINRILKNGGIARMQFSEEKPSHPSEYQNLFEIWDENKKIKLKEYLKKFRNIKFGKTKTNKLGYLFLKKSKSLKLNLKLVNYFDLNKINKKWWGVKAIYIKKK